MSRTVFCVNKLAAQVKLVAGVVDIATEKGRVLLTLEDGSKGRIKASRWFVSDGKDHDSTTREASYILQDIQYVVHACLFTLYLSFTFTF